MQSGTGNIGIMIPMNEVAEGMVTAKPVYARNEMGVEVMLVKNATMLTPGIIDRLNKYRVKTVMVLSNEPEKDLRNRARRVTGIDITPMLSQEVKGKAIDGIQQLFAIAAGENKIVTAAKAIRQLDDVVDQLVEAVSGSGGLVHIADIKDHDDYTYHHSLSVAVLSVAIGRSLKMNKWALRELGRAAIVHDVGKILVPREILQKPGKLTDEEFTVMKGHSALGEQYLRREGIGDVQMWAAVRGHHEKFDGGGYPDKIAGAEIPYFARIISVADVYDAVTSYRPYRGPMSPSVAFEVVTGDVGRAFDFNIVQAFTRVVEFYPKGTVVQLSNKRIGVVFNNHNTLRPMLRMTDDGDFFDLADSDKLHITIERVMENIGGGIMMS